MTITGDYLIVFALLLALGLTLIALRVGLIVFRMSAAVSWLVLGILFWTGEFSTTITDPWVYALSMVFILMIVGVLTLQMKTDIKHERSVRGPYGGFPGAGSESWTEWGPKKGNKTLTAKERQNAFKLKLAGRRTGLRKS